MSIAPLSGTSQPYDLWSTSTSSLTSTGAVLPIGAPGSLLTATGSNGTVWANVVPSKNISGSSLHVDGNAEFEGDVKIKGKSIADSLERIEKRLAILRPNEELEEKWENLRDLRKMYMELEAEIIEKEKMWKILNR